MFYVPVPCFSKIDHFSRENRKFLLGQVFKKRAERHEKIILGLSFEISFVGILISMGKVEAEVADDFLIYLFYVEILCILRFQKPVLKKFKIVAVHADCLDGKTFIKLAILKKTENGFFYSHIFYIKRR